MTGPVVAGLLAGWAVAVPVGAIGAYLVALAARTSWRTGAAAALGVAAADGAYALVAVLAGAAVAPAVARADAVLRVVSAAVLLVVAARTAVAAVASSALPVTVLSPPRAFVRLLALTLVNPMTLVLFSALVVGARSRDAWPLVEQLLFAGSAFVASATWQLLLAGSGAALGTALTGPAVRRGTALVSSAVVAALAVDLLLR